MANIKDIEKVVSLGSDINKLEEKVKSLKSQESVLEGSLERLKRETKKTEQEVNKNILISRQALEDEILTKNKESNKKEKEADKKLKIASIREEESRAIEQDRISLEGEKAKIVEKKKLLDNAKAEHLTKANLADLRAEQLATTLKELGKKPKEPKK